MIIVSTSGKGGVGKTTFAINLATALKFFGKDVVLVDANLTTPNVNVYLGFPLTETTLNHVLRGEKHITEAIYIHPIGLRVVPASLSLEDLHNVDIEKLSDVLKELKNYSDVIVLDSAAGLGREALAAITAGETVTVVVNPELPSLVDALKVIKIAEELGNNNIYIIVNKYNPKKNKISLAQIETYLEKPIIGIIPEDDKFKEAMHKKLPLVYLYPNSKPAIEIKKVAAQLVGIPYNPKEEISFLEKLFSLFRK
ncbi:MAG: cell division ATPase MinD [Nanoarchaeota archaeon]